MPLKRHLAVQETWTQNNRTQQASACWSIKWNPCSHHKLTMLCLFPFAGSDMAIFCLLCGKRFQTQPALQQHMEVHAGVRSYICSECNRTFPSHTALKRHLRSHTGQWKRSRTISTSAMGPRVHRQSEGKRWWISTPYICLFIDHTFWGNTLTFPHLKGCRIRRSAPIATRNTERHC